MDSVNFSGLLETCIPHLRAYARSLTRNSDAADDLVQDALVRGWAARQQFAPGTNFKAWMFTILRNHFLSERRRDRQDARPIDDIVDARLTCAPSQDVVIHFDDMTRAFWQLSPHHREILMFIGAMGLSYEETAGIIGCAVGTVRSRLSRARFELQTLLDRGPAAGNARRRSARSTEDFMQVLNALQNQRAHGARHPHAAELEPVRRHA
jgi:RNA polymerase sigma-70 factor (ECF subfamily)